ncbi:hypothetical protein DFR49_0132 [Hephaestia caeni]|uniref:Uncharacterized protein n=1 Tax=Hephaestia caeni TaxID=645617 RepID=A0A397PIW5_9SPHN|nr:hypothetical protein [Hephaestia caeni]RIA45611.1 hypothetical protein DFR49_0132 [Hephaestia caeni]
MKRWRWLKYVHWFGYLTSAVVILQLLFLGYIGAAEWMKREARRAETSMQKGPVTERLSNLYGGTTQIALLNQLPPLTAIAPDGLRFVAIPSFGDTYFAVSLRRTSAGGEGMVAMRPRSDSDQYKSFKINLSSTRYTKLTSELDALASSWNGESGWWTDGTAVAFERVKDGDVTSGHGNSPLFYDKIGILIFNAIRPSTPQLARFNSDWHPKGTFSAPSDNGS